jgi:hypothetical protein
MTRALLVSSLLLATVAHADEVDSLSTMSAAEELGEQGIGASLGIAAGGRVTPGGLRVSGHYLYQLSAQDWFDGTASFTFGSESAGCYQDRMSTLVCEHGFAKGRGVEVAATVRRMFAAKGAFRPFARAGIGVSLVRFSGDGVNGFAIPVHLGGGLRARVSPAVAVVTQGELQVGLGRFGDELGTEPQVGVAITAGAEFRLR